MENALIMIIKNYSQISFLVPITNYFLLFWIIITLIIRLEEISKKSSLINIQEEQAYHPN